MHSPVVTISFFKFKGFRAKIWAFTMMRFAHKYIQNAKGLLFYRLLGTGKGNGFNWRPDYTTYALLSVWENEEMSVKFLHDSEIHQRYKKLSTECFTVFMQPIKSHGKWAGVNPFLPVSDSKGELIAVITRASIDTKQLIRFWRNVQRTSESLENFEGLLFAKGIGEWPVKYMATFSLWKDEESMKAYAYKNKDHTRVIKKTRELNWYNEELFARFRPYKTSGTWNGKPLLYF